MQEVIYTSGGNLGFGWCHWKRMASQLLQDRELVWRFFLRELSARYRQSVFGYAWAVMPAVMMVVTFTYLNYSGALSISRTDIPYPAYVLMAMSVWQLFATGLIRAAQSLVKARAVITQINFSHETLVIAAFCESVFNFLIRIVLIAAVFVWFKVVPARTVVLVPLILVPLALITVGFGFILALANGVFRDIGNSLTILLTFAMFLTPVVYPPPTHGAKVLINYLNPVSPFITATRDLVIRGQLSQPVLLVVMSFISLLVFLISWRIFHLAMPRIAERI